jgi:hypothetical protein
MPSGRRSGESSQRFLASGPRRPQSFSWSWPASRVVNQTDEVEIIGHARQLATDSLQREKEAHGSTRTRE